MKYIAKKFGSLLLTLLLVSFLSFFAFSVIPGDAAKSQLGTEATPERIEALQKEMGSAIKFRLPSLSPLSHS